MIKNVIFDWSGTLVDDLPPVLEATNHVFAKAGARQWTLDEFRDRFQLPFTGFYEDWLPGVPLSRLEEWFHERFREVRDQVTPLPHAKTFLDFCRARRLKTFILSTVNEEAFAAQAKQIGFDVYFDGLYLGVRDKRRRIGAVLQDNDLRPEQTVFIGDMRHDIDAAKSGGVHSCAVLTGYNRRDQLMAAEPDVLVERLDEFQAQLEASDLEMPQAEPRLSR